VRLQLLAIGRLRDPPAAALFDRYAARCPWPLEVRELVPRGRGGREAEGRLLLDALPPGARCIVLDERGRELGSREFAERLGAWRDAGESALSFLLGGADGHPDCVRQRADLLLSLGPMTWPHELARVLLAEQIYRAGTILAGHPYHRD
jgi:23S rRNA (pseudouridine1915-N3)-methyltransferase